MIIQIFKLPPIRHLMEINAKWTKQSRLWGDQFKNCETHRSVTILKNL